LHSTTFHCIKNFVVRVPKATWPVIFRSYFSGHAFSALSTTSYFFVGYVKISHVTLIMVGDPELMANWLVGWLVGV